MHGEGSEIFRVSPWVSLDVRVVVVMSGAIAVWSMAHNAVEVEDISQLRNILDGGADVEDDSGDGWTLLRHAIDTEVDAHDQTGKPLHVDVTALLLSRGADPLRRHNGVSVLEEAEARGHWLAVELMRAWINRSGPIKGK